MPAGATGGRTAALFRVALCGLPLGAASHAAMAQTASQPAITVIGVDPSTHKEVPVPEEVVKKANEVYELHKREFVEYPPVDTTHGGRKNLFYVIRPPAKHDVVAAAAGDWLPYGPGRPDSGSPQGLVCFGQSLPRTNWCKEGVFSVKLNADRVGDWKMPLLLSHEFIHLRQYVDIPGSKDKDSPMWLVDGQANGIGYGLLETAPGPFSRRQIALRTKDLDNGNFSFFLGLRYYDRPLDVDRWVSIYPADHPEYGQDAKDSSNDRIDYAGYMTGSFWRHVLKGRPAGMSAFRQMLFRPGPADPTSSLGWLRWTDSGLKAAKWNDAPIWRGGIRQVYSEMIAEVADLPDIKVDGNRTGKLRAEYFDRLLWADGCRKVDLLTAGAAQVTIKVHPFSARCLRVFMPSNTIRQANMLETAVAKGVASGLPSPFNVTATGPRGCKNLELATRGQVVRGGMSLSSQVGSVESCVIIWNPAFAPLNSRTPGGLEGWQTVLLINTPENLAETVPLAFTLNFSRPMAKTSMSGGYTNTKAGKKTKKPFPRTGGGEELQMSTPVLEEIGTKEGCEPEREAIFLCGDVMRLTLATGEDAVRLVEDQEILAKGIKLTYLAGEFTRDGLDSLGDLYAKANVGQRTNAVFAKAASETQDGVTISIGMKRLEDGETGTFPATIFIDGDVSETGVSSLSPGSTDTDASGCLVIQSYATNGRVTITANEKGMLVGSLSATIYEENPDDEAACTTPRARAGQVTSSFVTPGFFSVGPAGKYVLDLSRLEQEALADQDLVKQIMMPLEQRSDLLAEDEMLPETRAKLAAYRRNPAAVLDGKTAPCQVSPQDHDGFIAAVAAGYGATDPAMVAQVRTLLQAMDGNIFASLICQWVAKGRPATFEMEEE